MILRYLIIILILLPIKAFALIEVDITRGNLNPSTCCCFSFRYRQGFKRKF